MPRTSRQWLWRTLTLAATVLLSIALAYETGRVRGSRYSPVTVVDDSASESLLSLAAKSVKPQSWEEQAGTQTSANGDSYNVLPSAGLRINGQDIPWRQGIGIGGINDGTHDAFADGSVSNTSHAVDPVVWWRLGDRRGGVPVELDVGTEGGKYRVTEAEKKIAQRLKEIKADPKLATVIAGERDETELLRRAVVDVTGIVPEPGELEDIKEKIDSIEGKGPGQGGDRYREIIENRFLTVFNNPLSTFSIDVDTASYSKVRRLLLQARQLPPPDAVRIEEFINYFHYNYPAPKDADGKPFAVHTDVASCPWNAKHKLLRIGIKGKVIENKDRPPSNLVFLVDVSGSMDQRDKLPLVKRGLATLVERLRENDRVAIVVYAGAAGLVLDSTPGSEKKKILDVLDALQPGGSTAGAQGIHLAYELAQKHFIKGGTNRVILSTDGDFNVGTTSTAELVRLVEEKAKSGVFLTTLGFGVGNHNDSMLEQIADKGNGNCAYIDSDMEARKVFVEQLGGTLVTIAKDVKIQVEFNPGKVAAYRLIGYENRMLRTEDFKDDTKDAGEIGAGHTVTALYELVPVAGASGPVGGVSDADSASPDATPLKYQRPSELTPAAKTAELATVYLRYKEPDGDKSKPLEFALKETDTSAGIAAADFKFAAAVASFGMLLRNSKYRGDATFDSVLKLAAGASDDEHGYRAEFLEMVKAAKALSGGK